jgi:VanZ family protein
MSRSLALILICWLVAFAALVSATLPQGEAPHLGGSDKLDHMVAFFTLAFLARLAYPRRAPVHLFLAIVAFGGAIELVQMIPAVQRDAEWRDWFADIAATLVGLALATPLLHGLTDRKASPASDRS